jgi:hypothetical protein
MRKSILLFGMAIFHLNSYAQEGYLPQQEKSSNVIKSNSLIKSGLDDYIIYEPNEVLFSKKWPDEKRNYVVESYNYAGDINGDGINDMFYYAGNCSDDRTEDIYDITRKSTIFFGRSDFSNLMDQILYTEIIPIGDMNGDSYSDAVGINEDNSWQYYLGSATGMQEQTTVYYTQFPDIICKFFDIDEDGYDDIIVHSANNEFEIIFGNNNPESFDYLPYNPTNFHIGSYCKVGDIDGTGNKIISFFSESSGYEYQMYLIAIDEDRSLNLVESKTATKPETLHILDVDGDGFKEIVYTTGYNPTTSKQYKTFVFPKSTEINIYYSENIVLFDLLNDSRIDYIGDVNDDNKADFCIKDNNESYYIVYGKTNFIDGLSLDYLIDIQDMSEYYFNQTSPNILGDVNGDGVDDFCFNVDNASYFGHRFFFGNASNFNANDILYELAMYKEEKLFQTKNIGDINGDGFADVAFLSSSNDFLKIYTSSTFESPNYELNPTGTESITLVERGDFNGDGISDIAVNVRDNDNYSSLRVDFYFGGNTFDLDVDHTINFTTDLSISIITPDGYGIKLLNDINGDGKDDYFLYGGGKVFIFYGRETLTKIPDHTISATEYFGSRTVAGDLNDDGIGDFAISGHNNEGVSVYFGKANNEDVNYSNPDLLLTEIQEYGYNSNDLGQSLTSGDFNGDGIEDIAAMPYVFREEANSGEGIEGLYIFYGGQNMDDTPDKVLKIPAQPFEIDVADYISKFAGELTSLPDMNNDDCDELYISGGWIVYSSDNTSYQQMQNGIVIFGGNALVSDSIPAIQLYSSSKRNGAKNSYYYSDAHSAYGDFDRDGELELLSTNENPNFIGTTVYKYNLKMINNSTTSSSNILDFNNVKIYPNPVEDKLVVDISGLSTRECKLQVYSLDGKLISYYILNENVNEIDFRSFQSSLYILKLVTEDKNQTYKIIKK